MWKLNKSNFKEMIVFNPQEKKPISFDIFRIFLILALKLQLQNLYLNIAY